MRVLTEALAERPGSQVLTDQGTPYMAAATRDALDALGAEHAPQKEGDPCGKGCASHCTSSIGWSAGSYEAAILPRVLS